MRYIIDRFEGDFALCENELGEIINVKVSRLPQNAKEGDVLLKKGEEFVIDVDETEKRKQHIKKLLDDVWI